MGLREKYESSRALRLLCALLLNALFLALTLLVAAPAFESNDDRALASFVDGQMSVKCAYIPYINIVLGFLLKGIYSLLGDGLVWWTLFQYALLLAGFTAISFTMLDRLRLWQGALVSLVLLLFIGFDAYTVISYTKTASVATVGGVALMLYTMEDLERRRALPLALGILLALFGFMLRYMEFLPCAALTAVLGLRWLLGLLSRGDLNGREKLRALERYLAPFLLLLLLAAGLYATDGVARSRDPWAGYGQYDAVRVALTDYGIPEYRDAPQQYQALNINENAADLFCQWNFFDTEKFSLDTMETLISVRGEVMPSPSWGECLGILLDKCVTDFFIHLPVYSFCLMALLFLACGEHGLRGWATLLAELALFALLYLYLIRRGRYMVDRVDLGLFLAMCTVLARLLKREALDRERLMSALTLLLALALGLRMARGSFRFGEHSDMDQDKSQARAAVDTVLADGRLFLAKVDAMDDTIYGALEPFPAGYADRIVLLGGWNVNNPAVMAGLARYGVENPYRDMVDNDRVCIIEDDIASTLEYIRDYYAPSARAEPVEPLSSETGLEIYRILS